MSDVENLDTVDFSIAVEWLLEARRTQERIEARMEEDPDVNIFMQKLAVAKERVEELENALEGAREPYQEKIAEAKAREQSLREHLEEEANWRHPEKTVDHALGRVQRQERTSVQLDPTREWELFDTLRERDLVQKGVRGIQFSKRGLRKVLDLYPDLPGARIVENPSIRVSLHDPEGGDES